MQRDGAFRQGARADKGKKASFIRLCERIKERITNVDYQQVVIGHADCLEDALELKELILEKVDSSLNVRISYIGPMVGASVGPGTMGVYFYGVEETYDSEVNN